MVDDTVLIALILHHLWLMRRLDQVDLTLNPIPVGAALAIAPFLNKETNKKTALFTIDHTLPPEIFEQLYRSGTVSCVVLNNAV